MSSSAPRVRLGVRNQQPTDVEWFKNLEPGWQHERIVNFTQAVTGAQPDVDLVSDGWTEVMWVDTQKAAELGGGAEALERIDFEAMEAIRQRVDEMSSKIPRRRRSSNLTGGSTANGSASTTTTFPPST